MKSNELSPDATNEYQRSAQQLFDALAASQEQPTVPHYYMVEWDARESKRIADITIMTAEATGARRRERFGEFHDAQFYLTERTSSGTASERFVWCATGPQSPGTPIELDLQTLQAEHRYTALTNDAVVRTLCARAVSADDYITLIKTIHAYEGQPIPTLLNRIYNLIYQFSPGVPDKSSRKIPGSIDQPTLFELLEAVQLLGADIPKETQGHLVSQLLRIIATGRATPQRAATDEANSAAMTLETAIRQGVIADEPRNMDRIFTSSAVLVYPFATDILYTKLQADAAFGSAQFIFGIRRTAFVGEYITAVIRTIAPDLTVQIDRFSRNSYYRSFKDTNPRHLYRLMNNLVRLVDEANEFDGPAIAVESLTDVAPACAYILSAIGGGQAETTPAQAAFNVQCADVIEMILAPMVQSRVGAQALFAS